MINEFFENKKKLIISLLILVALVVFYMILSDEKEIKSVEIKQVKIIEDKPLVTEGKEVIFEPIKVEPKKEVKKIVTPIKKAPKKEFILYKTSDEDGKYNISLKSNIKDNFSSNKISFITITGAVVNGENEHLFSLPFNENYQEFLSEMKLVFINKKTKVKSICDVYFLDAVTPEISYFVKAEVSDDYVDCYIASQSDFTENQANIINNDKYEQISKSFKGNKIEMSLDLKDKESLENTRIIDRDFN